MKEILQKTVGEKSYARMLAALGNPDDFFVESFSTSYPDISATIIVSGVYYSCMFEVPPVEIYAYTSDPVFIEVKKIEQE